MNDNNSNQTFSPERLKEISDREKEISDIYEQIHHINRKCDIIRDEALLKVSGEILEFKFQQDKLMKKITKLHNELEDYRQKTCGHLEYNDGKGIHMCVWCGVDL